MEIPLPNRAVKWKMQKGICMVLLQIKGRNPSTVVVSHLVCNGQIRTKPKKEQLMLE